MCSPNAAIPQPISEALWIACGSNCDGPTHFEPIQKQYLLISHIAMLPTITTLQTLLHKDVAFKAVNDLAWNLEKQFRGGLLVD